MEENTKKINKNQDLIEDILSNEEKKDIYSSKIDELSSLIKNYLSNQRADDALNKITLGALSFGSSDIHFDTKENSTILRFRIDGLLTDISTFNQKEYKLLIERFKYSSNLKLNITDIPQDGKYSTYNGENKIDVRVSTLPTKYGENMVCRVLDSSKTILDFKDLGFFWSSERMIKKAISKKNGLILVTGPTGSGKTSTLYTILNKLNSREKKIATLEDPIEYDLAGIVQSEVNEKKGYTFQIGLKALLRQDPDIIMVGEIRDNETLNTATTASLTGHLVLSTLHTKSAADTLDRLINMGMKPYILASAIDTIIAQRLVRKICPHCKKEKEKSENEINLINNMLKETGIKGVGLDGIKLYHGEGCEHCNNSGYKGRIGVYEIISLDDSIRNLIREGGTTEEIIEEARKSDMITMHEDGILKAIKGHTTIEEVLRII